MNSITLASLEFHLDFFHTMYDIVRLVDPIEKRVLEYRKNRLARVDSACHAYWGDGGICDNCISVRAHQEGKCFMKLEKSDEVIMLVTAMPIEGPGRAAVVELLKNATDTMLVGTGVYDQGHPIREAIEELNRGMVSDDLTGLYNRRYVNERLPSDLVRTLIEERPLSVIFLDIDNLKAVNDALGHASGDEVIQCVAAVIARQIREGGDWAARLGGDEFLICLPGAPEQEALRVAQRIRRAVEAAACGEVRAAASVSLGVYTAQGEHLSASEIVRLADARMYEAKRAGKNRVFPAEAD